MCYKPTRLITQRRITISGFYFNSKTNRKKAIEHFQRVTQFNPTDAEAYFNLGVLFVTQNQLDHAEEAYNKGIELQPNSVEGQFNVGAFYEFHKQNLQKAKYHYQKYLELRRHRSTHSRVAAIAGESNSVCGMRAWVRKPRGEVVAVCLNEPSAMRDERLFHNLGH